MLPVAAIIGAIVGLFVGYSALQPLESGVTTISVCWAEDPSALAITNPHVHNEFIERSGGCWTDPDFDTNRGARTSLTSNPGQARDMELGAPLQPLGLT